MEDTPLIERMLTVIHRRRWVVGLPFFAGKIMATGLDFVAFVTGGLIKNNTLTRDQLTSLRSDNIVSPKAKTLATLGIKPTGIDSVLPEYLWCYRPAGQYSAIKDSAKNMKKD